MARLSLLTEYPDADSTDPLFWQIVAQTSSVNSQRTLMAVEKFTDLDIKQILRGGIRAMIIGVDGTLINSDRTDAGISQSVLTKLAEARDAMPDGVCILPGKNILPAKTKSKESEFKKLGIQEVQHIDAESASGLRVVAELHLNGVRSKKIAVVDSNPWKILSGLQAGMHCVKVEPISPPESVYGGLCNTVGLALCRLHDRF